jgi:hypothetical protein
MSNISHEPYEDHVEDEFITLSIRVDLGYWQSEVKHSLLACSNHAIFRHRRGMSQRRAHDIAMVNVAQ